MQMVKQDKSLFEKLDEKSMLGKDQPIDIENMLDEHVSAEEKKAKEMEESKVAEPVLYLRKEYGDIEA